MSRAGRRGRRTRSLAGQRHADRHDTRQRLTVVTTTKAVGDLFDLIERKPDLLVDADLTVERDRVAFTVRGTTTSSPSTSRRSGRRSISGGIDWSEDGTPPRRWPLPD